MTDKVRPRRSRRRVPVILVSGVQESAMLATSMSLQLGLPQAVSVRHIIDVGRQVLTRVVSDLTGIIEHEEINLAHACVSCAIREDIVPTLERLAAQGHWKGIIACLPIAAEAVQVCRVACWAPRNAPHVAIAAVVTALDGTTVVDDLLGDDLLDERGLATAEDDRRGVAEVASAMVEYADMVSLTCEPDPDEAALVRALARPRVPVVTEPSALDAVALTTGTRHHESAEHWVSNVRRGPLPPLDSSGVWRLDLQSDRSFHPVRLQEEVVNLGGGPRRSRGCFWLPTRPDAVCVWDGAGGQASIGSGQTWDRGQPVTRITVVGLDDGAAEIVHAFHRCLLTDEELATRGRVWNEPWDGLEPWLGPIAQVA
ncbi:GTP-binding protein [Natronosporangium hydrolyticum]|uniref:GTP-binding protein n=1 Tax=Natronosporangium hydrolyticum TaxID=2811111 RepID=A0A895YGA9_9ACTN|nr:GTP-binding protein [Natronosporangium hydrolyticum]QSB15132.1 GTP-binding protein [Natronosporangium hydrolyticum]